MENYLAVNWVIVVLVAETAAISPDLQAIKSRKHTNLYQR